MALGATPVVVRADIILLMDICLRKPMVSTFLLESDLLFAETHGFYISPRIGSSVPRMCAYQRGVIYIYDVNTIPNSTNS
jgi:hypothetical protein